MSNQATTQDIMQDAKDVSKSYVWNDKSCLHKNCPECHGSGRKPDGSSCIHMISCNCPQCSPGRMICSKY